MKKRILTFTLTISLLGLLTALHIKGLTLVTKFTNCEFSAISEKHNDDIAIYMPIYKTQSNQVVIPFLYDKIEFKEPYYCILNVIGDFKRLEAANVIFALNNKKRFTLPLDIQYMNKTAAINKAGKRILSSRKFNLPIKADTTDTLTAIIVIKTISKDNKIKQHAHATSIKKTNKSKIGNKFLSDMIPVSKNNQCKC